jgi:hypothetical protein
MIRQYNNNSARQYVYISVLKHINTTRKSLKTKILHKKISKRNFGSEKLNIILYLCSRKK